MSDLRSLEGKPQFGTAITSGVAESLAEFCLQGRETYVSLHNAAEPISFNRRVDALTVKMTDGTWVTFLGGIVTNATNYGGSGHVATILPSYALVGRHPVAKQHSVVAMSLSVDDAETIFYDFDAFSVSLETDDKLKELIASQAELVGRPIEVGEHPIVTYFTGKFEILSVETVLGKISVRHQPRHGFGGPQGVSIKNRIHILIEFHEPKPTNEAVISLMPLLRFLQIMAGRKQKIRNLRVKLDGVADTDRPWLEVVWCLAWERTHEGKSPQSSDLPINGGTEPDEFAKVLANWLEMEPDRRDARVRFSGCFAQGSYNIDRLVSAANMFDILPADCFAEPSPLSPDFVTVRDEAKKAFKALPKSDARSQALGDLGRLGQLNLKAKVLQRANKLLTAAPGKYPDLDKVLKSAIDARNHYVHGSAASRERAEFYNDAMGFHIDTLEFVFGTADLLDAGWDYNEWAGRGTTMSHRFGAFRVSYSARLAEFVAHRCNEPSL